MAMAANAMPMPMPMAMEYANHIMQWTVNMAESKSRLKMYLTPLHFAAVLDYKIAIIIYCMNKNELFSRVASLYKV